MRALILSDIHANLEALEAVFADAQLWGGFDAIWCLGDTVGYGPDPNACIDRIREFELVAVAGNHDCAAVGLINASDFNDDAKAAAKWTANQLDAEPDKPPNVYLSSTSAPPSRYAGRASATSSGCQRFSSSKARFTKMPLAYRIVSRTPSQTSKPVEISSSEERISQRNFFIYNML